LSPNFFSFLCGIDLSPSNPEFSQPAELWQTIINCFGPYHFGDGSQLRMLFLPREHLETSGDVFGCHSSWRGSTTVL
jgi:hypothetical protein